MSFSRFSKLEKEIHSQLEKRSLTYIDIVAFAVIIILILALFYGLINLVFWLVAI